MLPSSLEGQLSKTGGVVCAVGIFLETLLRSSEFQNSWMREMRHLTTVVTHVFWHTNSVPENVGAELLRRI